MGDKSYEKEEIREMLESLNNSEQITMWSVDVLLDLLADPNVEAEPGYQVGHAEEIRLQEEKEKAEAEARHKEHVGEVTSMDLPLEWENAFEKDERVCGIHADSIADGFIDSLANLGRVDIEYISLITGESYKKVISALRGSIYQNPETWEECFFKGWETADEYLSGNLHKKLLAAEKASTEYDGYFDVNIKAIKNILPKSASSNEIYATIGSPWIPTDIIDEFISELLGKWKKYWSDSCYIPRGNKLLVKHDEVTGAWEIPYKSRASYIPKLQMKYNTGRINILHIIERTLNMKAVAIYDDVPVAGDPDKTKKVINKAETLLAMEKQELITHEFTDWLWKSETRKKRLESIYEEKFGCVRKRNFDGSFLNFPGLSDSIELFPYQKDAVARIIFTASTLLAHDVGAGKTYVMIAAGMEIKRMGISNKNMFVVPNNIVGQWESIFCEMYPDANLVVIEPKSFTIAKRNAVLTAIRDNDYDGIIIAYSSFEQIKLSSEYYHDDLLAEKTKLTALSKNPKKNNARLRRKIDSISKGLTKLEENPDSQNEIYFDELGITALFVDEAHNFKNVPIDTQVRNVLGLATKGSKKCKDMLDKVRVVQKESENSKVIFATGTPITNSITDAYVMQTYLQSGELALLEISSFDNWLGMFAEKNIEFEVDVDTNGYRLATRFSKFHNLPELTMMISQIADFHKVDTCDGIPRLNGYTDSVIGKTAEFNEYLKLISVRADAVRRGVSDRKEDNMLKITTDGRKAALDLRLVDSDANFTYQSKVARCASNAADIYFDTMEGCSTQLIFSDISTPKEDFNIYDEVKRLLILCGVPEEEIAFIHDADTEKKRNAMFEKVRQGDIRILIGSTFKLGIGVNVQDKLIAIHHLDVPWRPADMTQREGRILRQGNTNPEVKIFRYITEGSFDAYSWQLLETKERFISDLLSGNINTRSSSNINDTILDYAEVKALAVGNPLVKKRVEISNEMLRLITLQNKYIEERIANQKELDKIPAEAKLLEKRIKVCELDLEYYKTLKIINQDSDARACIREKITRAVLDNILETREKKILTYQGFDVILPANMTREKPYIYLIREGKYYIKLGESSRGNLIRIDNFLDGLPGYLEKLKLNRSKLLEKESELRKSLSRQESFTSKIEDCQKKIIAIDKELGVEKND